MDRINWPRTRDILICVICVGIIFWASWSILGQFVEAIVILLLSMAVAFLITPAVNFLVRFGAPRLLAALLVYLAVFSLLGWVAYALIASLVQQVGAFSSTITSFAGSVPDRLKSFIDFLENNAHIPATTVDTTIQRVQSPLLDFATSMATNAPNIILLITNVFVQILLVAVLSFYFTLDGKRIRDSLVSIAPKRSLPNVLLFEDALNRVVGNYIRGQLTLAVIVGVCTGLFCVFTGLGNYALICGALAFMFETIPMVGPGLASITPILLSLLLKDPYPRTLILIGLFVALQMVESNVLGPRIVGHAVGLHPVAAILSLLVGAQLFGVFGALLATPIVAAAWVVVASIYRSARGESADQMLARKRAPWQIRRPVERFGRGRGQLSDEEGESSNIDPSSEPSESEPSTEDASNASKTDYSHEMS
ncbi:AI-2E family transporter [Tengunoibacter tsumagoiensis]|uniref:AI-2E family transporter n=1 Tax=Tengunoibacter tsumagoiensis TaxID=2014871 RepID=A0A401ZWZ3_9CHLR|nr:AI-2E family transporter [Tengunoibacter tsumagoiensis]GCE11395.1 AI-2E family transporter [Tengunoibacter tsumagoiensis]